jgi:hypothetical protein
MKNIGISIGWNCGSASFGVETGLRSRRGDGYRTCPFDLMLTNYDGLVQCLRDDFKYLYDENYLKVIRSETDPKTENAILHTLYKFGFNHEGPGHGDLYITENWIGGANHFVDNNFAEFKSRYSARVQNFRDYLSDPNNHITFILTTYNKTQDDLWELKHVLKERYPHLKYDILIRNEPQGEEYYLKHMRYMESI